MPMPDGSAMFCAAMPDGSTMMTPQWAGQSGVECDTADGDSNSQEWRTTVIQGLHGKDVRTEDPGWGSPDGADRSGIKG